MNLKDYIRDVPDFPSAGILFRDITPLIGNTSAFDAALILMYEKVRQLKIDKVAAIESRGFIFGAPLAKMLGVGFIPIRKKGKLPYITVSTSYELEYGSNTLEVHSDALTKGERVLIVDDVLATGGTSKASGDLIRKIGGEIAAYLFLIELTPHGGRAMLADDEIATVITY